MLFYVIKPQRYNALLSAKLKGGYLLFQDFLFLKMFVQLFSLHINQILGGFKYFFYVFKI